MNFRIFSVFFYFHKFLDLLKALYYTVKNGRLTQRESATFTLSGFNRYFFAKNPATSKINTPNIATMGDVWLRELGGAI